jgi:hypothetical protein
MNATGEHLAMLNQKKLAVAVTVALGASVGFTSSAQAVSSLFFPHVVGSQSVASIISVINTASNRVAWYTNGNLHQTLWTKSWVGEASNAAACEDYNQYVTTSFNDITSFDVYGQFGQATNGILFENRVTTDRVDNSNDPNWSVGINTTLPQRGFLLVSNEDSSSITDEGVLRGEAFIFEFGAGATWGYQAASRNPVGENYDYATAVSADNAAIGILPYDEFETGLMVTPVDVVAPIDQNQGALSSVISLTQRPGGTRGFFDRDENPFSISRDRTVTCVGRVDVEDLLFSTNGAFGQFLDGGWTTLEINARGGEPDSNAIVFKLEYNMTDSFNGEAVTGVFNNATHILPAGGTWVQ